MLKYVKGDIIDLFDRGEFDMIMPGGYNCQITQGKGLAESTRNRWPEVYHSDVSFGRKGDRTKLGILLPITVQRKCMTDGIVLMGFTQFKYQHYNPDTPHHFSDLVSYNAIHEIFKTITSFHQQKIAISKIGCANGGGDWEIVEFIINKAMRDAEKCGFPMDITVVEYEEVQKKPGLF